MTEAEAVELMAILGANAITSFTVYVSFTFAFLAAAFFVGSKLSTFQSLAASGLFCVSSGAPALTQIIYIQAMFAIMEKTETVMNDIYFMNGMFWVWTMSIIQASGIVVSLLFFWQVRRSSKKLSVS
jgi:hypothetical protein